MFCSADDALTERRSRFVKELDQVYDFDPSKLSRDDLEKKSNEISALSKRIIDDQDFYLPVLREQIRQDGKPSFFYLDGARLLMECSNAAADSNLAASALCRGKLDGISDAWYFGLTHRLATKGADVTCAVNKILDKPEFKVFLVDHVITLPQQYCVLYCVLPMDEDLYLDNLVARLQTEKDATAARSILLCLFHTVSAKGQKAIEDYAEKATDGKLKEYAGQLAKPTRKADLPAEKLAAKRELLFVFLEDYITRRHDNEKYDFETYVRQAPLLVRKDDYKKIKELRRKLASRVSDEALDELAYLTDLLRLASISMN